MWVVVMQIDRLTSGDIFVFFRSITSCCYW